MLYRQLRRAALLITNRFMATRLLTSPTTAASPARSAFDTRTGEFQVIRAKAVILCCGAAGRLGLPASGYLFGTYENPTNAGDGYAMAYHAGAELADIECFQINPLIKDYNGPACAYVTGPFGGYTANNEGERFIECDYWSGQMMLEFYNELQSGKGPVFLKLDHLRRRNDHRDRDDPAQGRASEPRPLPRRGAAPTTATSMVEMHISEIGFCSGHSASGVWVNEHARTTVPGLYAAGDMACVPHNYMLGAFTYGSVAGERRGGVSPTNRDFAGFDAADVAQRARARLAPTSARTAFRRTRSNTSCAAW